MAFDVTTEWADIHRRLGNYVPLEPKVSQEELMNKAIDVAEGIDPLKYKTAEQLKDLEEDNMDDEFIREWRAKRLAEVRSASSKREFRNVFEISKQDYVREICEAGEGIYVLLHLYQDYVPACRAINAAFEVLCDKFPTYKFVKIVATRCVENFRDRDCPAILIYRSGQPVKQFTACGSLFGPRITPESIEWKLHEEGIWETELETPPDDRFHVKRITRRNSDSDEESDDRDYYTAKHPYVHDYNPLTHMHTNSGGAAPLYREPMVSTNAAVIGRFPQGGIGMQQKRLAKSLPRSVFSDPLTGRVMDFSKPGTRSALVSSATLALSLKPITGPEIPKLLEVPRYPKTRLRGEFYDPITGSKTDIQVGRPPLDSLDSRPRQLNPYRQRSVDQSSRPAYDF